MSLSKIIQKFKKAKSAINSFKGIAAKLKSLDYDGIINDQILREQADKARELLDDRRKSLQDQMDSNNIANMYASRKPDTQGVIFLTYPKSEPCRNWIHMSTRPRADRGGENPNLDIQLYVPDGATTSGTAVDYTTMDTMRAGVSKRVDDILQGGQTGSIGGAADSIGQGLTSALGTVVGEATGGYSNFKFGVASNPSEEMQLDGLKHRSFDFSFEMRPKNADEAKEIQQIVTQLKIAMLPDTMSANMFSEIAREAGDLVGGTDTPSSASDQGQSNIVSNYYNYPNVFDIRWRGPISNTMEGFMPCVLTSVDVTYSDPRLGTFHDGSPLSTELKLSFQELLIVTQQNYLSFIKPGAQGKATVLQDPAGREDRGVGSFPANPPKPAEGEEEGTGGGDG